MLCDRAELCGGLCTQVGLELSPGFVCACVQGKRAGTAGTRALKYWERTEEGEDKASGVQVCAQMCVMVVEET